MMTTIKPGIAALRCAANIRRALDKPAGGAFERYVATILEAAINAECERRMKPAAEALDHISKYPCQCPKYPNNEHGSLCYVRVARNALEAPYAR